MAESKHPIHSETEAEAIRKKNERQATEESRRKREIRRRIEAMEEAKELGIDYKNPL